MRRLVLGLLLLLFAGGAGTAPSGQLAEKTVACPIGGKEFVIDSTTSLSVLGQRLDLKTLTSAPWVKWPPICPDNGFPVYRRNFSEDELERFRAIVFSEAFAGARETNLPSYMLYFVKRALGSDDYELGHALLVAIWDAEEQSVELYRQYMRLAISHFEAHLDAHTEQDDPWWTAQILVANFERKLGNFDLALTRLDGLPTPPADSGIALYLDRIADFAGKHNADSQRLEE